MVVGGGKGSILPAFDSDVYGLDSGKYYVSYGADFWFDQERFRRDLLQKVLSDYRLNAPGFIPDDFNAASGEQVLRAAGNGAPEIDVFQFDRARINALTHAEGEEIGAWFDNLLNASKRIVELKDMPSHEGLRGALEDNGFVSMTHMGAAAAAFPYVPLPQAPVLPGGAAATTGYLDSFVAACSSNPYLAAAVITVAVSVIALAVCATAIEREITCVIVNDTPYDLNITGQHIEAGHISAVAGCGTASVRRKGIPARVNGNLVSSGLIGLQKNFGFYGAEATFKLDLGHRHSLFVMLANPMSESTRVDMRLATPQEQDVAPNGRIHASLYGCNSQFRSIKVDDIEATLRVNGPNGPHARAVLTLRSIPSGAIHFSPDGIETTGGIRLVDAQDFKPGGERGSFILPPDGKIGIESYFDGCGRYQIGCNAISDSYAKLGVAGSATTTVTNVPELAGGDFGDICIDFYAPPIGEALSSRRITLRNESNVPICFKRIKCYPVLSDVGGRSNWMAALSDNLQLSEVNLPASHDAAAINIVRHTVYACHRRTISEQLDMGIRAFDVRIKVLADGDGFSFVTCHGSITPPGYAFNEFESLRSLFDQLEDFLSHHPSETLVVMLKVDHWADGTGGSTYDAFGSLATFLEGYRDILLTGETRMRTVGETRGKIVLFNRFLNISGGRRADFGHCVHWRDRTHGEYALDWERSNTRDFKVFVQDEFMFMLDLMWAESEKAKLVQQTVKRALPGDGCIYLNYMSSCKAFIKGVYCQEHVLNWLGETSAAMRPKKLGWVFMDYEDTEYYTEEYGLIDVPGVIIDSNFQYKNYPWKFRVS